MNELGWGGSKLKSDAILKYLSMDLDLGLWLLRKEKLQINFIIIMI